MSNKLFDNQSKPFFTICDVENILANNEPISFEEDSTKKVTRVFTINGEYGYQALRSQEDVSSLNSNKFDILIPEKIEKKEMKKALELIQILRKKTKASMSDCKNVIQTTLASHQDYTEAEIIDEATASLRKLHKTFSTTDLNEGIVIADITKDGTRGALIALTCQTEPSSQTKEFQDLADSILDLAIANIPPSTIELLDLDFDEELTIREKISAVSKLIGEGISLSYYKSFEVLAAPNEFTLGVYNHFNNKLSVIGLYNRNHDEVAKNILMHIAASNPLCNNREDLLDDIIENERSLAIEKIEADSKLKEKTDDAKQKIISGSLAKFYKEAILSLQDYDQDPKITAGKYMDDNKFILLDFDRFKIG